MLGHWNDSPIAAGKTDRSHGLGRNETRESKDSWLVTSGLVKFRISSGTPKTLASRPSTSNAVDRELPRSSTSDTETGCWVSMRVRRIFGRRGASVSSSAAILKMAKKTGFAGGMALFLTSSKTCLRPVAKKQHSRMGRAQRNPSISAAQRIDGDGFRCVLPHPTSYIATSLHRYIAASLHRWRPLPIQSDRTMKIGIRPQFQKVVATVPKQKTPAARAGRG